MPDIDRSPTGRTHNTALICLAVADDPDMADIRDITPSYASFPARNGKALEASVK